MNNHSDTDRYLRAAICFAAVIIVLLLLWFASDIFLLVFGGVLVAIILRTAAHLLAGFANFTAGWALLIVLILIAGLVALTLVFVGPTISSQVDQLQGDVPAAWNQAEAELQQH